MDGETLQQKAALKGTANYRIYSCKRVVEKVFGILSSRVKVLLGSMEQSPRVCQRHCFHMCGVAQHAEDTLGQIRRAPTKANDVVAL